MISIGVRWKTVAALAMTVAPWGWSGTVARGQVAYQPVVSPLLNGVALQAAPVVSADRRYVRMTLNPYFNAINGFTTYSAPIAAVGGGGFAGMGGVIGGGGVGGFGGGGGGFGGAGAFGASGPMPGYNDPGTYLAGAYPPQDTGFRPGPGIDPFAQPGVFPAGPTGADAGPAAGNPAGLTDPFAFAEAAAVRPVRPAPAPRTTARRQAARRSSKRPAATADRRPR